MTDQTTYRQAEAARGPWRACLSCGRQWQGDLACPLCREPGQPPEPDSADAIRARYRAQGDHNLAILAESRKEPKT